MSYIMLRGHWCDIIVLNVHDSTEDKITNVKDRFYEEPERVFDKFLKYHMKMLGDFSAKIGREDISNQQLGMRVFAKLVMIMDLRVVNFATSKNLIVKSTMFPHRNIHKVTWTSPVRKTHNQIDHFC
jgi:hypothetical protein